MNIEFCMLTRRIKNSILNIKVISKGLLTFECQSVPPGQLSSAGGVQLKMEWPNNYDSVSLSQNMHACKN